MSFGFKLNSVIVSLDKAVAILIFLWLEEKVVFLFLSSNISEHCWVVPGVKGLWEILELWRLGGDMGYVYVLIWLSFIPNGDYSFE